MGDGGWSARCIIHYTRLKPVTVHDNRLLLRLRLFTCILTSVYIYMRISTSVAFQSDVATSVLVVVVIVQYLQRSYL